MRETMALVGGAGLGAGLMYLLDPERGPRRRAQLGEAMTEAAERLGTRDAVSTLRSAGAWRAMAGGRGLPRLVSELASMGGGRGTPRLVSELASVARDPRSLRPAWRDGRLRLRRRGPADLLDRYRWSLLGVAVGVLAAGAWALWRREPGEVRESITVAAPPERVYDAWSRFESFPRFMPAVREVRSTGPDRMHWVVDGPAGTRVEFESVVTRRERPHALAWRTVEGTLVSHGGTVRFRPSGTGSTRVDVVMWWRPAGGGAGEGAATLSGLDPGRVLHEGLARFKTEVEQGRQESPAGMHGVRR